MNDLISIIIPVYNVEECIGNCLDSIINQTYKNIEIILINDGSKDNSLQIIKEYEKKDKRIIVKDRENKGVLYTRVEGFKLAKGKYVTYIDSDDWVENNIIEVMYNKAIKYDADVVKCQFGENDFINNNEIINGTSDQFIKKEQFEPDFYDKLFKQMNIHNVWAQLFKRELLEESVDNIDTNISLGDDLELNLQLFKSINNILFIQNKLYHYRVNNNTSVTRTLSEKNINKNIISVIDAYYNAYKIIDEYPIKDKTKYKSSIIIKLIDEISKWQIDLIGILDNKKETIKQLNWCYNENNKILEIKKAINDMNVDINKMKYKIFYTKIDKNINQAYTIGKIIWTVKSIYRPLKKLKKR